MIFASVVFFFSSRRRHTRYWRDWSSDVCSSDLDDVGGPLAGEREVHPGAVRAHLAARDPGVEVAPDHTREDVQRRVVPHVGESPLPLQRAPQIPHGIRDGLVHDVDYFSTLSPHVHDHGVDGADAERSLVRRLAPAAGIEGGPVEYHLPAFQLYYAGFELLF